MLVALSPAERAAVDEFVGRVREEGNRGLRGILAGARAVERNANP